MREEKTNVTPGKTVCRHSSLPKFTRELLYDRKSREFSNLGGITLSDGNPLMRRKLGYSRFLYVWNERSSFKTAVQEEC